MSSSTNDDLEALRHRLALRHYRAGWLCLLVFLSLGLVLESLHGFKVGFYLDPGNKIRREMWTLAHAHGTLLALIQIAFAVCVSRFGQWTPARLKLASSFLLDAALLMPLGFFLGGLNPDERDPGLAILLVPVGGLLLLVGVALIAWSGRR
jgi:hypothetical protein